MPREAHSIYTNEGATGAVTITLPQATSAIIGARYRFATTRALNLTVATYPSVPPDVIRYKNTTFTSLSTSQVGNYLEVVCLKPGEWQVTSVIGFGLT
jgi:hypothetical protein